MSRRPQNVIPQERVRFEMLSAFQGDKEKIVPRPCLPPRAVVP
jgi:hypothetical protein